MQSHDLSILEPPPASLSADDQVPFGSPTDVVRPRPITPLLVSHSRWKRVLQPSRVCSSQLFSVSRSCAAGAGPFRRSGKVMASKSQIKLTTYMYIHSGLQWVTNCISFADVDVGERGWGLSLVLAHLRPTNDDARHKKLCFDLLPTLRASTARSLNQCSC